MSNRMKENRSAQKVRGPVWLRFSLLVAFGDRMLRVAISGIMGIAVYKYLPSHDIALLGYYSVAISLLGAFSALGLSETVRVALVERSSTAQVLAGAIFLRLVAGVVGASGLMVVALLQVEMPLPSWQIPMLFAMACAQSLTILEIWFQVHAKMPVLIASQWAILALGIIGRIVLVKMGGAGVTFLGLMLAELIIGPIITAGVLYRSSRPALGWSDNLLLQSTKLLKRSWPLWISSLSVMIYMRASQMVLAGSISTDELANYVVAQRCADIAYIVPSVLYTIYSSSLASHIIGEVSEQSRDAFMRKAKKFILACVAIATITGISAPWGIELVFGARFPQSWVLLVILSFGVVFVGIGMLRELYFVATNNQVLSLICAVGGALTSVVGTAVIAPKFGSIGAAWCNVAALAVTAVIIPAFSKHGRRAIATVLVGPFARGLCAT